MSHSITPKRRGYSRAKVRPSTGANPTRGPQMKPSIPLHAPVLEMLTATMENEVEEADEFSDDPDQEALNQMHARVKNSDATQLAHAVAGAARLPQNPLSERLQRRLREIRVRVARAERDMQRLVCWHCKGRTVPILHHESYVCPKCGAHREALPLEIGHFIEDGEAHAGGGEDEHGEILDTRIAHSCRGGRKPSAKEFADGEDFYDDRDAYRPEPKAHAPDDTMKDYVDPGEAEAFSERADTDDEIFHFGSEAEEEPEAESSEAKEPAELKRALVKGGPAARAEARRMELEAELRAMGAADADGSIDYKRMSLRAMQEHIKRVDEAKAAAPAVSSKAGVAALRRAAGRVASSNSSDRMRDVQLLVQAHTEGMQHALAVASGAAPRPRNLTLQQQRQYGTATILAQVLMDVEKQDHTAIETVGKHVPMKDRVRRDVQVITPRYTETRARALRLFDRLGLPHNVRDSAKTAYNELWDVYEKAGCQIRHYTCTLILALHHACLTHTWHVAALSEFVEAWAYAMVSDTDTVCTARYAVAATSLHREAPAASPAASPLPLPEPLVKPEPGAAVVVHPVGELEAKVAAEERPKKRRKANREKQSDMKSAVQRIVSHFPITCNEFLPRLPMWVHAPEHVLFCRASHEFHQLFRADDMRLEPHFKHIDLSRANGLLRATCQVIQRTRERYTGIRRRALSQLDTKPEGITDMQWKGMTSAQRQALIFPRVMADFVPAESLSVPTGDHYMGFACVDALAVVLTMELCRAIELVDENYTHAAALRHEMRDMRSIALAFGVHAVDLARARRTVRLCERLDRDPTFAVNM